MTSRVRGKGTGQTHGRGGGRISSSTPGTSSSRTSATRPLGNTGISTSVSRIAIGNTRDDVTRPTGADPTQTTRDEMTPVDSTTSTRADSTRSTRVGLTELYITGEGYLMPPKVLPQACTRSFKKIRNETGYTWKLTPKEIKNAYWEDFKKDFWWDSDLESLIYDKWKQKAARRYCDFCHGMKFDAMKATDRIAKIAAKPDYITSEDWLGWLAYWEREDVKEKAAIAKRCRMSKPEGPGTGRVVHRGGSKSIVQFVYELAAKKGCTPRECLYDAYCITHTLPDGTYTDAKSERIGNLIKARAEEMRTPLPGTTEEREVDWNQAFLDVVPLDAKNRLFGTGELAKIVANEACINATRYHTEAACGSRLSEVELKLTEEREVRHRLEEKTQKLEEAIQNQQLQIERLMSQSGTHSHTSSP